MAYTKFRIEATHDDTLFKVYVRNWLGLYVSAYVHSSYFAIDYTSKQDALHAIEGYKNRFTEV